MNTDQFDNSMPPEYLEQDTRTRETHSRNSIDLDDDENDLESDNKPARDNRRSRAHREPKNGKAVAVDDGLAYFNWLLVYRFLYQPPDTVKEGDTFGSSIVSEAKQIAGDLESLPPKSAIEKLPIEAPKVTAVDVPGGNTPKTAPHILNR